MAERLIIWLPERSEEPWAWYAGPDARGWADDAPTRAGLAELGASQLIIIVPGTWVRMFDNDLPPMRASERQQAAGFSIEDRLAAPASAQHLTLGAENDPRIAVIAKSRMDEIRAALSEAGLPGAQVFAEYDVLPGEEPLSLWGRTIWPGRRGYALDNEAETPDSDNPLSALESMDFDGALNLAQGSYADKNWQMPGGKALGRLAAMLAIAGLCGLFWTAMKGRALNLQAENLSQQAAALYTQATGKDAPADPARAVRRARANAPAKGADFMSLSGAFLQGFSQVEGVAIDTIRYDESSRELVLRLIYPGFDTAGQLEAAFETTPGQFRSGAVRDQNGKLIGDAVFTMETHS